MVEKLTPMLAGLMKSVVLFNHVIKSLHITSTSTLPPTFVVSLSCCFQRNDTMVSFPVVQQVSPNSNSLSPLTVSLHFDKFLLIFSYITIN